MNYVGNWIFHSIGVINDNDEFVYLTGEEYLASPMPYIDETDEDAVADEINERKQTIKMQIKICEDGNFYSLMPLPEGVSQEEVDAAVQSGEITLIDGMMTDKPCSWEERDGDLYVNLGISDEPEKINSDDGFISIMTMRFTKVN